MSEISYSSIKIEDGDKNGKNENNNGILKLLIGLLCATIIIKEPNIINLEDIISIEGLIQSKGNENKEKNNEEKLPVMWSLSSDLSIATRTYTDSEGKTSQVQYEFSDNARKWYKKFIENYPDANQMERNMTIAALSTLDKGITYSMKVGERYNGVTLDLENNKIWDCSGWYCEVVWLASGIDLGGGRVTGTVIENGDTNIIKTIEDARPSDAFLKNMQAVGGNTHVVFYLGMYDGCETVIHCTSETDEGKQKNGGVQITDFHKRIDGYPVKVRMNFMKEYLDSRNSEGRSTSMSDTNLQNTLALIGEDEPML